ncbi:hypothetical protein RM549_07570 [Salegentibacter sp. F188]|uniref:ATP synthase protein I n=1 Tax=Autumnicola patrickiae TaxID=3075591 RepID=A0ABU3E1S5_9FLAO|nr:hypothetical protein [Salegentibacter sp. F188]MDT0689639.1 hypothetical protein [Salegentibacter sp. F188]
MKGKLLAFLKILIPFALILSFFQFLIIHYIVEVELYYSIFSIYTFHFLVTFLIFFALVFIHGKFEDKTGLAFMGLSLFKMLAAIIFLLPMMLAEVEAIFGSLISFFLPYFFFLILETIYVVKLINSK